MDIYTYVVNKQMKNENIVWDRLSQYIGWYIIYNNPNLGLL